MLDARSPRFTDDAPAQTPRFAHKPQTDSTLLATLLTRVLDEVDYGVALVNADAQVLYANHRTRELLTGDCALQWAGERLRTRDTNDSAAMSQALSDATTKGLRRLVVLGQPRTRLLAALVPVQTGISALLLGRNGVCEELSMQCYARSHALTTAEERVLTAVGRGITPTRFAREQGVKLSTVRTQLGAIRHKTGASNITDIVRLVAALPPMVSALRA
jgi:DNA-binding CsgD family transcriptional regulator